jgi:hypothetical protein
MAALQGQNAGKPQGQTTVSPGIRRFYAIAQDAMRFAGIFKAAQLAKHPANTLRPAAALRAY